MNQNGTKWSENVIVVDADYVDGVTFNLIVNFERMLGRRIPQADMARWLECVALDGGVREGKQETSVVLIHEKEKLRLRNFVPSDRVYSRQEPTSDASHPAGLPRTSSHRRTNSLLS